MIATLACESNGKVFDIRYIRDAQGWTVGSKGGE